MGGSPGTHCSSSGLHSALQKSRILLPSDAYSSSSPLPKDLSKAPSPKHLIFKFYFPGWAGWGALGEKAVIFAGESASRRGRGAALGDSLPALSLSGAPALRAALPPSPRLPGAADLDSSPAFPAGRWPETLSPPAAHPCRTHLAAPRSRRHARNWAPARTRSCSRSSSSARCRTETRPRHCPAPAGRAGRARAAGLFGHPGSLPRRCRRRLPRRRLPRRRRCRCAPGLQTASWASLGRAHRAPPALCSAARNCGHKGSREASGQGRRGRPAAEGSVAPFSAPGRVGRSLRSAPGSGCGSPRLGPHPRSAGGWGGGRARAAAARAPQVPGWLATMPSEKRAGERQQRFFKEPLPGSSTPSRPPARQPSLSAFSSSPPRLLTEPLQPDGSRGGRGRRNVTGGS